MTIEPGRAIDTALIDEIKAAREANGWTQAQLADLTQGAVSKEALSGYETGHRMMRVAVAWELAQALNINLSELIERAEANLAFGRTLFTINIPRLLASTGTDLAPVRAWILATHGSPAHAQTRLRITETAMTALCELLQISTEECIARFAPYTIGPRRER